MPPPIDRQLLRDTHPHDNFPSDKVAAVQRQGRRLFWPDHRLDLLVFSQHLPSGPNGPISAAIRQAGRLRTTASTTFDSRGAGPYGPVGEALFSVLAYQRARELGFSDEQIEPLYPRIIAEVAARALQFDLNIDLSEAQEQVRDGAAYGRLVLPWTPARLKQFGTLLQQVFPPPTLGECCGCAELRHKHDSLLADLEQRNLELQSADEERNHLLDQIKRDEKKLCILTEQSASDLREAADELLSAREEHRQEKEAIIDQHRREREEHDQAIAAVIERHRREHETLVAEHRIKLQTMEDELGQERLRAAWLGSPASSVAPSPAAPPPTEAPPAQGLPVASTSATNHPCKASLPPQSPPGQPSHPTPEPPNQPLPSADPQAPALRTQTEDPSPPLVPPVAQEEQQRAAPTKPARSSFDTPSEDLRDPYGFHAAANNRGNTVTLNISSDSSAADDMDVDMQVGAPLAAIPQTAANPQATMSVGLPNAAVTAPKPATTEPTSKTAAPEPIRSDDRHAPGSLDASAPVTAAVPVPPRIDLPHPPGSPIASAPAAMELDAPSPSQPGIRNADGEPPCL
ncbi:hypothetical protein OC834_007572, partial [Tilletia horrida]